MGRVNFSTSRSLTKAHISCVGNYNILHEAGVNKFHDYVNKFKTKKKTKTPESTMAEKINCRASEVLVLP